MSIIGTTFNLEKHKDYWVLKTSQPISGEMVVEMMLTEENVVSLYELVESEWIKMRNEKTTK